MCNDSIVDLTSDVVRRRRLDEHQIPFSSLRPQQSMAIIGSTITRGPFHNGIDSKAATLVPIGGEEAASALRTGKLDAAFFVISPRAPIVREILAIPGARLLNIERAPAYALQHHFLTVLTLPEGAMDLRANLPRRQIALLAPAATLVVSEQFHPALAELLLTLARQIHGEPGLFEQAGDFSLAQISGFPNQRCRETLFQFRPAAAAALSSLLGRRPHRSAQDHTPSADHAGLSAVQAGSADLRLAYAIADQPLVQGSASHRGADRGQRTERRYWFQT